MTTREDVLQFLIEECRDIDFNDADQARREVRLICNFADSVYRHYNIFSLKENDSPFIRSLLSEINYQTKRQLSSRDIQISSRDIQETDMSARLICIVEKLLSQSREYDSIKRQLFRTLISFDSTFSMKLLLDNFGNLIVQEMYCKYYNPEDSDLTIIVNQLKTKPHHSLFDFFKRHPNASQYIDELYNEAPQLMSDIVKFKIELDLGYTTEDFKALSLFDCGFEWIEKYMNPDIRDAFISQYFKCHAFSRPLGEFISTIANNLAYFDNPTCLQALKDFYIEYCDKGQGGRVYHPCYKPNGSGWVHRQPKDLWLERLHNCIVALERGTDFKTELILELENSTCWGRRDNYGLTHEAYVDCLQDQLVREVEGC